MHGEREPPRRGERLGALVDEAGVDLRKMVTDKLVDAAFACMRAGISSENSSSSRSGMGAVWFGRCVSRAQRSV